MRNMLVGVAIVIVILVAGLGVWLATGSRTPVDSGATVNRKPASVESSARDGVSSPSESNPRRDDDTATRVSPAPNIPVAADSDPRGAAAATRPSEGIGLVTGRVIDRDFEPIEGVEVYSQPTKRWRKPERWVHGKPHVRTDAAGEYRMRLRERDFDLFFVHPDYADASISRVRPRPDEPYLVEDIVLGPGGSLAGRVVDAAGNPLTGVLVSESPAGGITRFEDRATTNSDGHWRMEAVDPGLRLLRWTHEGYATEVRRAQVVEGETQQTRVELEPERIISGRVVDESGQPIPEAYVNVGPSMETAQLEAAEELGSVAAGLRLTMLYVDSSARTDEDGRFSIDGLSGSVVWKADALAEGYTREESVVPPSGIVDFTLAPAFAIRGRVIDAETRQPVARFSVDVVRGGLDAWSRSPQNFSEGVFELVSEPPGVVTLVVSSDEHVRTVVNDIIVVANENEDLEILLHRGSSLSGVVRSAAGPVQDASVVVFESYSNSAYASDGSFEELANSLEDSVGLSMFERRRAVTDADGRFRLEGLSPGPRVVQVKHPSFITKSVEPVEVAEATHHDNFVIVLEAGGGIEGTVFDASGFPLAGAEVMAGSREQVLDPVRADGLGIYRFEHVEPGEYVLAVGRSEEATLPNLMDYAGFGDEPDGTHVVVVAGAVTKQDLRLEKGGAITGIVRANGKPRKGVLVSIFRRGITLGPLTQVDTNAKGRYVFEDIEPGDYGLKFVAASGRELHRATFSVAPGVVIEHDVELPDAMLQGRVIDSDGDPISGVRLTAVAVADGSILGIDDSDWVIEMEPDATSDADGRFRIEELRPGDYRVVGKGTLWIENSVEVTVDAERGADVELRLSPGGSIRVQLVDAASGDKIEWPIIELADPDGNAIEPTFSFDDESLDFTWENFVGLKPGTYRLRAAAAGYAIYDAKVEIEAGKSIEHKVPMRR